MIISIGTITKNHQGKYALPDGQSFTTGDDEGKTAKTIHKHIQNSTLALFQDAFDPLKDIFNEMVLDFLRDSSLHEYGEVSYA
ncbi:hypothetical protein [Bacillus sp. 123MFChir2]|uniref:hypothetical protein n=1 Tax=Bacillus sp. 123MFChir2 TaxID=1169144 RepID=UPI00037C37AA|nr:hypothetical protein [Bacillus sp. 123MFChir2]